VHSMNFSTPWSIQEITFFKNLDKNREQKEGDKKGSASY
jgi:hypothetical protein